MNYYLDVLKRYAVFTGRARRKEYWMFSLINVLVIIALVIIEGFFKMQGNVLVYLYELAILLPSLGVTIRRLHDTDRSGWFALIAFVPIANIALLVFALQDGTRGSNRFGEDPKFEN